MFLVILGYYEVLNTYILFCTFLCFQLLIIMILLLIKAFG